MSKMRAMQCQSAWGPLLRELANHPELDMDQVIHQRFDQFVARKNLCVDCVYDTITPMELLTVVAEMEQDNYMTRAFSGTNVFSFFGDSSHITDRYGPSITLIPFAPVTTHDPTHIWHRNTIK